jgi:hypothetical protein
MGNLGLSNLSIGPAPASTTSARGAGATSVDSGPPAVPFSVKNVDLGLMSWSFLATPDG